MTKKQDCRNIVGINDVPNIITHFGTRQENKSGVSQVFLFVYIGRFQYRFKTGVKISATDWDDDKLLVRKSCKKAAAYNLLIRDMHSRINDIIIKYRLEGIPLSGELLQEEFYKPEYVFNFNEFMDKAIDNRQGELTESTIRQHNLLLAKRWCWQKYPCSLY